MEKQIVETSKFLSYVLRHKPDSINLTLGENGWVAIDDLMKAANQHGQNLTRPLIEEVVQTSDKQRFSISSDNLFIRANQGHSIEIDLDLKPTVPPEILYHGTPEKFVQIILKQGLKKMQRHHVHMSPTIEGAKQVGQRRGKPVILEIDAQRMFAAGHSFFVSENGVWLTEHVPSKYLSVKNL